jgi:hypothetical protein
MNRSTVKHHAQLAIRFGNRLWHTVLAIAVALTGAASSFAVAQAFELEEVTIAELQRGMQTGQLTARSIVESYLKRIEEIDQTALAFVQSNDGPTPSPPHCSRGMSSSRGGRLM